MRAGSTNLNHCAVPFLSRAVANLYWYYTKFSVIYITLQQYTAREFAPKFNNSTYSAERGQKLAKSCEHLLWMAPNDFKAVVLGVCLVQLAALNLF